MHIPTVAALCNVAYDEGKALFKKYFTKGSKFVPKEDVVGSDKAICRKVILPETSFDISNDPAYLSFLSERFHTQDKYEVRRLINLWKLTGTKYFDREYPNRIIIPTYYQGQLVSFQTRTIYKQEPRYITAPLCNEIIHHKDILFGMDFLNSDRVLLFEGPFDVMRIGPGCLHPFGITFTPKQVKMLCGFREVFIGFDRETKAQERARQLARLCAPFAKTYLIKLDWRSKDPGDSIDEDVRQLRELIS